MYLESDGQGTLVRGDRSQLNLPGENPDEFPNVTSFNEEKYHELAARLFREIVRRTVFATDNESSRYALGGVLLGNGRRQNHRRRHRWPPPGQDGRPAQAVGGHQTADQTTIVPTRAMNLLERALNDDDGEIQLAARGNDILVSSPRFTIYSRLVEGRFPKWRDVFPRRSDVVKIELAVGPFHAAVRQAAIVTSEESRGIDFTFGDGLLVLSGRAADVGQSRVELPIAYNGPKITITLDPRFVSDFLRVLDPEKTFTLELKDPTAPRFAPPTMATAT